ncbi:DJ-1/PfpI family protein [Amycolatopsis pigmentata]|uniref:DJ-1/PfpI family protein n=1 Tax=Amycolatopsis pigmentata TaxID=450801 RepID=A0ABW5FKY7_9PSEU
MTSHDQSARSVGILAFDSMEILDYAGPYDVFNVANTISGKPTFSVHAIGVKPGPIVGRGDFAVLPPTTITECTPPDILIVPGGPGTGPLVKDTEVIDWVRSAAENAELVVSVCTGALVLAAAGLLENRPATTHHWAFEELQSLTPSTTIIRDQRFVQSSEKIWTSAGISAGIDLALHLVDQLTGTPVHDKVIAMLEWGW